MCAAHVDLSGRAVLSLDDDFSLRSVIRTVLKHCGCDTIFSTGNGHVAMEMLEQNRIDLVICDMQMEAMDGLTFMRQARANPQGRDMAAIMLTAGTKPEDAAALEPLRIGAWLFKPISTAKLIEGIGLVLGERVPKVAAAAGEASAPDLSKLAERYAEQLKADVTQLEAMVTTLLDNLPALAEACIAMRKKLHSVKGQAGTFGFNLVTALAARAHDLLVESFASKRVADELVELHRVLRTIVTAMSMVAKAGLRGDGGKTGVDLLAKIDAFIGPLRQRLQAEPKEPGAVEELVWSDD